jgi:hypothetical protein
MKENKMRTSFVLALTASTLALSACSGGMSVAGPAKSNWGETITVQRPSLDPNRQPSSQTEQFSEFDPSAEFVLTDVGDVTCDGYGTDSYGRLTGGPVQPLNGKFYAVKAEMKVLENKWMEKGTEMLNANNFSYVSPSGEEHPAEKIASLPASTCLRSGGLSMFTYEGESDSGMIVFDIPNETGGKLVHQRYEGEKIPEEEFPLGH